MTGILGSGRTTIGVRTLLMASAQCAFTMTNRTALRRHESDTAADAAPALEDLGRVHERPGRLRFTSLR
jgi:hypothetical protein